MSEHLARRSTVVTEKQVLTEFLQLYKRLPCLWDQNHVLYGKREERDKAYEVLLEKYKLIQEDAVIADIKRKIEYMRCAFRREHKKVLIADLRGEQHKPILWYFDLLSFLNDNAKSKVAESMPSDEESYQETHEIEDSDDEGTQPKKIKMNPSSYNDDICASQHHNEDLTSRPDVFVDEEGQTQPYIINNAAEAFGRMVGLQLKELLHVQRVFAEKLISDVIYQARLGNLNAETTVNLNDN